MDGDCTCLGGCALLLLQQRRAAVAAVSRPRNCQGMPGRERGGNQWAARKTSGRVVEVPVASGSSMLVCCTCEEQQRIQIKCRAVCIVLKGDAVHEKACLACIALKLQEKFLVVGHV